MKFSNLLILAFVGFGLSSFTAAQQPSPPVYVAPNAPADKPVISRGSQVQQLEEAIKPYVEQARSTYPAAKARFLQGLPPRHSFFVTTKIRDGAGRFEQVFIAVRKIGGGTIDGLIWSDMAVLTSYKKGDPYRLPETDLIDWTITKPDGTEEGNFVGKFLETYRPQHAVSSSRWTTQLMTPERLNQRIEDVSEAVPEPSLLSRFAVYDIGYPHTDQEYNELDGNAVILITALVRDRNELPLRRVYVIKDGQPIELKLIKQAWSDLSGSGQRSVKAFGPYRSDGFYLLPIYLRTLPVDLFADFAGERTGFKMATFGTPLSKGVAALPIKAPTGTGPSAPVLDAFIKREYPGVLSGSAPTP